MADTTPNPHRDEPTPAPQEGMRPEAAANLVRPEQDEELGPLPGLLNTAAAEAVSEVANSPEAEAQEDAAGVEDEGIESGQIMGITLAILVTVFLLGFTVFWAFYMPKLGQTQDDAESGIELLPDGQRLNAEAEMKLADYSMNADSTFTMPMGLAMKEVAESYAGQTAPAALEGETVAGAVPMAVTRQGFNMAPIALAPARAARAASARGAGTAEVPETATDTPDFEAAPETGEQIGVDEIDARAASGVTGAPAPSLDE